MRVIFITSKHFGRTLKESFWPHRKSGPACFDLGKQGSLTGLKFVMPVIRHCWLLTKGWS